MESCPVELINRIQLEQVSTFPERTTYWRLERPTSTEGSHKEVHVRWVHGDGDTVADINWLYTVRRNTPLTTTHTTEQSRCESIAVVDLAQGCLNS
ncbi:unnamed protein product [Dicrocoelium dendriticum]|nr:unnamed protein product [Dicrocoelium dendriticum]